MLRELFILRHAKTEADSVSGSDFDRELTSRGIRDITKIANWMKEQYLLPELVICSTASRARQTAAYLFEILRLEETRLNYREELYLADLSVLLSCIKYYSESHQSIMLIGHNPGLEDLLLFLSSQIPARTRTGKLLTTSSLAQLKFAEDQTGLKHAGKLVYLIRPSEL